MKTLHPLAPLFLAVAALVAQPALAQTSAAPITGDKMPTADQLPPKPAKADRKSERIKAREAIRTEAPIPPTHQPVDALAKTGAGPALARGEMAIPTEPTRKKSGMLWVGLAAAVVVVGGVGALVALKQPPQVVTPIAQPPPVKPPVETTPKPPTEMVVAMNTAPPPPAGPAVAAKAEVRADKPPPDAKVAAAARPARAEALPPEVAE